MIEYETRTLNSLEVNYTIDVQEGKNEDGSPSHRIWFCFENFPDIKFTYMNIKFEEYDEDKQLARLLFDLDYQYQVSDEELSPASKEALKSIAEEKITTEQFRIQVDALLSDIIHKIASNQTLIEELDEIL